uniref:Uncharacterized protein n=1 Tax=Strigamia maritima TaxID=126957 RepID=T1JK99_STRMM
MGSRKDNSFLYPKVFSEFARVLNPENGRAVILTADTSNFHKALDSTNFFFNLHKKFNIMIGGMNANQYVCYGNDYGRPMPLVVHQPAFGRNDSNLFSVAGVKRHFRRKAKKYAQTPIDLSSECNYSKCSTKN